ncbi:Lysophospholipid acyltransferase [Balamuthia mandrillaris]
MEAVTDWFHTQMAPVDAVYSDLSLKTGFPADQLKCLSCWFVAVPLAVLFRYVPGTSLRHLFSILVSIGFCLFCLGPFSWGHAVFSSAVTYLILLLCPLRYAHRLVFVWVMGYMSVSHIYRMWDDYMGWNMDFTAPQLILTIKLTSMGYNYYDGRQSDAYKEKLHPYQREHMISKLPSLLEYFGWVFFFPTFLAGPSIELTEYLRFVDGSVFKEFGGKAPSSLLPTLAVTARALFLTAPVMLIHSIYFPISYLSSEAFFDSSFLTRATLVLVITATARFKYYLAWYLGEISAVACGFGYNGRNKDGSLKWDRATNSYPLLVELPSNVRDCTANWNIRTAVWLRYYVYLRFSPSGKPDAFSTIATYTVSAFWHGFYPGYYYFFLTGAIITESGKVLRRSLRSWFLKSDGSPLQPWKFFYDIIGRVLTMWVVCYAGSAFILLSSTEGLRVWSSVYFLGHILTLGGYLLGTFLPRKRIANPESRGTPDRKPGNIAASPAKTKPKKAD